MSLRTLRRFLSGLLLGGVCGAAMFAIAAVSGYSLAQVQMTRAVAREPELTPTVEEIQRALERITADPYPLVTPTPFEGSAGRAFGSTTATAVNAAGTPESPPASTPSRSATPFPQEQAGEAEATPSTP